jgi:mercuric reductase
MVRRGGGAPFMGNARVFPGGTVGDGDRGRSAAAAVRWSGPPDELPWRAAALRELAEEAGVLTSATLMDLERLPSSLIVLGGRAVALELGQMMAHLGVQVTILQRSGRLLPEHEPEINSALQDYLVQDGIEVVTGVQVERIALEEAGQIVYARVDGDAQVYRAEHVLMALGRTPSTEGMGLSAVGVELDAHGAIVVDGGMRTSHPDVYATGDCTTNPLYVYVAAAGGAIAAENALTGAGKVLDLSAMPAVIFTDQQVATVGLTEVQASARGYDVRTSVLPLDYVPRALAARDTRGLIKLVADAGTGQLLGAHVLAAEGAEVVQTAALAIKFGATIGDLAGTLFPYLTQVEGLKLAAQAFDKDVSKLSCCAA